MFQWMLMAFLTLSGATLAGSVKIINQGDEALVEFLGRYDGKKLEPGLNFITPFLSQVVFQETIREKVLEIPPPEGSRDSSSNGNYCQKAQK